VYTNKNNVYFYPHAVHSHIDDAWISHQKLDIRPVISQWEGEVNSKAA